MTQEEKVRAYDEAIKKAKEIKEKIVHSHLSTESCKAVSEYIDTIIPELAMGEDEKIIQELIDYLNPDIPFKTASIDTVNRWLAYLEKQKEQPTNEEMLRTLRAEYEKGVADTIAKYEIITKEPCKENANSFTSEDERICKDIIQFFRDASNSKTRVINSNTFAEWAEYLEKQKHLYETAKDRFYREGFEEGQLYERQKEQKPAEWNDTDMKEARDNLISVCRDWERGEQTTLLPAVAVRARYFLEHLIEPKPAEWSEEDEDTYKRVYHLFRDALDKWYESVFAGCYPKITKKKVLAMLKPLHPKKNISYGELPLVSIDYMEGLDTDFEKQVGAVIASAMNREHQFTSKYIKWAAQQLMESVKDKQNSEEKHAVNKEWSDDDKTRLKVIKEELERFIMFKNYGTPLSTDDIEWLKNLPERFNLQPKQEWSEKDRVMLNTIIANYEYFSEEFLKQARKDISCPSYGARKNFEEEVFYLKSLPERFNLQPKQERSEEDGKLFELLHTCVCRCINDDRLEYAEREQISKKIIPFIERLESLRPQPISQSNTNNTVWHNASEEKPAKLPIIHIWNQGNSVSAVVGHENIGLQRQLGDINFQPDDKWAYVEDLLNVQPLWKPSEEQMRAVFAASERNDKLGSVLSTLYNDLKKHYDLC